MISRDEATIAMINVAMGTATSEEKELVETMDERLFSDIYSELETGLIDKEFSIENYYEVDEDEDKGKEESTVKTKWGIDDDHIEDEDIKEEFDKFFKEFGCSYDNKKMHTKIL